MLSTVTLPITLDLAECRFFGFRRITGVVNQVRPSQVVDDSERWTLVPALDRHCCIEWDYDNLIYYNQR